MASTNEEDYDLDEFSVENEAISEDGDINIESFCICDFPTTDNLVFCCDADCPVNVYHKACVGLDVTRSTEDWLCETCKEGPSSERKDGLETLSQHQSASATTSLASSSKAKMKYPKRRFGKADVTHLSLGLLTTALESVFTAPVFKLDTPIVRAAKVIAQSLMQMKDDVNCRHFSAKIASKLWKKVVCEIRGKSWTEEAKLKMWQQFHVQRTDSQLYGRWKDLLHALDVERHVKAEILLFQHIVDSILQGIVKAMMDTDMPDKDVTVEATPLDRSEEQALRYCVGYIPVKLQKRYSKMKSNASTQYLELLRSWSVSHENVAAETIEDYTCHWMNVQNRGGLFKVSNTVYDFFKSLEMIVRSVIHVKNVHALQHVDIQEMLALKFKADENVMKKWQEITSDLPPNAKLKLFEEVIKCFTKMRCEAFVRVYLMIRKEADTLTSRKGEKALRKGLSSRATSSAK